MKKEFLKVCHITELSEKKGYRFFINENTDIALFKIGEKIYAVDNVCPHNHTPKMYLGYIEDEHVLCPIHFFKFHLQTGKQTQDVGCTLNTYQVKIEDDFIYVEKPNDKSFNFNF